MTGYSAKNDTRKLFIIKTIVLICISFGFILSSGILDCSNKKHNQKERTMTIEEVLKKYTPEMMSIAGVIGTAQGRKDGKDSILIFVIKKTKELTKKIPPSIEGFPVIIEETGEIKALE